MERYVTQNVINGKFSMLLTFDDEQYSVPIKATKTHPYYIWNYEKCFLTEKEIRSMEILQGERGAIRRAMEER